VRVVVPTLLFYQDPEEGDSGIGQPQQGPGFFGDTELKEFSEFLDEHGLLFAGEDHEAGKDGEVVDRDRASADAVVHPVFNAPLFETFKNPGLADTTDGSEHCSVRHFGQDLCLGDDFAGAETAQVHATARVRFGENIVGDQRFASAPAMVSKKSAVTCGVR
jgi:hypothetical protein